MTISVQGSHDPEGCFQLKTSVLSPAGPVPGLLFLRSQSYCGVGPVHQCSAELPAAGSLDTVLSHHQKGSLKRFLNGETGAAKHHSQHRLFCHFLKPRVFFIGCSQRSFRSPVSSCSRSSRTCTSTLLSVILMTCCVRSSRLCANL